MPFKGKHAHIIFTIKKPQGIGIVVILTKIENFSEDVFLYQTAVSAHLLHMLFDTLLLGVIFLLQA